MVDLPPNLLPPQLPVRRLGKYELLCRLSTGGMSEIFLGAQEGAGGFRKWVVLKSILPSNHGQEDFVRMFLDEACITAAFNHPHIAQVYDLGMESGRLFLAMEFVEGCTLVELAKAMRAQREPIPVGFTLAAVRDAALALHYAHTFTDAVGHSRPVIHRDVAEKNIMVSYEGVTKLLDFGIAKFPGGAARTRAGLVKGTSGYMSPEQIRGEPLDGRSDIFSLGVVLHECLTGLRLFHGKTPEEGLRAALRGAYGPPSRANPRLSSALDAVTMKALAQKRTDRFATALDFARALERIPGEALWLPEDCGALVRELFSDRRERMRALFEAVREVDRVPAKGRSLCERVPAGLIAASSAALEEQPAPPSLSSPPPVGAAPLAPPVPAFLPGATPGNASSEATAVLPASRWRRWVGSQAGAAAMGVLAALLLFPALLWASGEHRLLWPATPASTQSPK